MFCIFEFASIEDIYKKEKIFFPNQYYFYFYYLFIYFFTVFALIFQNTSNYPLNLIGLSLLELNDMINVLEIPNMHGKVKLNL